MPNLFKTQCLLMEITNQADLCGSLGGGGHSFFFFFFGGAFSKESLISQKPQIDSSTKWKFTEQKYHM